MKGMIAWFAENHVAANLLMLFLLLAGAFTLTGIKMEVFPETSLDVVLVSVVYPGASPAEVEEALLNPIEEQLAGRRSPFPRAEAFSVHDLIDPRETRPALCRWIEWAAPLIRERRGPRGYTFRP